MHQTHTPGTPARFRRLAGLTVLTVGLSGCGPAGPDRAGELPMLALSADPFLEIGLVEGDDHYLFQEVVSVVTLSSGSVAVADAGDAAISVYSPSGAFSRRFGGEGDGPGELRWLARLYALGADSLMALDARTQRLSVYDTAGAYARQAAIRDGEEESPFALDVWLYGRFFVDGALLPEAKERVQRTLNHLPPPVAAPGYRFVHANVDGSVWIREPEIRANGTRRWIVVGAEGRPRAMVDVPTRFDPMRVDAREAYGRWLGENGVHLVRAYHVEETGDSEATPTWIASSAPPAQGTIDDQDEILARIRPAFRALAGAQEMHYASHYTYSPFLDSLDWERPSDIEVDVVSADRRGWVGVFTHPLSGRICALGYGYTVPPGWTPGEVACGPPANLPGGN